MTINANELKTKTPIPSYNTSFSDDLSSIMYHNPCDKMICIFLVNRRKWLNAGDKKYLLIVVLETVKVSEHSVMCIIIFIFIFISSVLPTLFK